jgi:hypothetical protein
MTAEWPFHIDEHAAALQRQGLSPADAARDAVRAFGSPVHRESDTRTHQGHRRPTVTRPVGACCAGSL